MGVKSHLSGMSKLLDKARYMKKDARDFATIAKDTTEQKLINASFVDLTIQVSFIGVIGSRYSSRLTGYSLLGRLGCPRWTLWAQRTRISLRRWTERSRSCTPFTFHATPAPAKVKDPQLLS